VAVHVASDRLLVAIAEFGGSRITELELHIDSLQELRRTPLSDPNMRPLSVCYDEAGRLYVGTQDGINRYESGRRVANWKSAFNDKGRQVWGIAIRGNTLICTEGSDNEKYWMRGSLSDRWIPVER